jgi:hypothetical protein
MFCKKCGFYDEMLEFKQEYPTMDHNPFYETFMSAKVDVGGVLGDCLKMAKEEIEKLKTGLVTEKEETEAMTMNRDYWRRRVVKAESERNEELQMRRKAEEEAQKVRDGNIKRRKELQIVLGIDDGMWERVVEKVKELAARDTLSKAFSKATDSAELNWRRVMNSCASIEDLARKIRSEVSKC